jgi:hypothetical protein
MADENEVPKDLGDFIKNVFGSPEKAEEFAQSLEDPMVEAWKGFYEVYVGLRSGGFTPSQANHIMGVYLYQVISGMEGA